MIARRQLLRCAVVGAVALPFAACALWKTSKTKAAYQPYPNDGERCGDCRHFVSAFNACTLVDGHIEPDAWCRLWEP